MKTFTQQFTSALEGYLQRSGTDATSFGKKSVGSPSFVFKIRAGTSPRLKTADKVLQYIADNPARRKRGTNG
jgi:predicted transcriptional regulator